MSFQMQGLVGATGGLATTSLTWLVNMDFKGMIPTGLLCQSVLSPFPSLSSLQFSLRLHSTRDEHSYRIHVYAIKDTSKHEREGFQ